MKVFCQMCGKQIEQSTEPCPFCGHVQIEVQPTAAQQVPSESQPTPEMNVQMPYIEPAPAIQNQPQPTVIPMPPKPLKPKKEKKKHKLPWLLRFIIANVIIAAVLLGLWYAFGNMITLYIHSEDVVETLNSGSLKLEGTQTAYDELPDYIKDMLGEENIKEEYGPVTQAVLPYISVERVSVNGFFDGSSVTYEISAPDLESWLLNLDANSVADENEMLSLMIQYMESAPLRTVEVVIDYERSGFFSVDWRGNYYTREFSDAICGGINSAYNVLYEQAMDEFEQLLSEAEEVSQ